MDPRRLQMFLAVARELNFSRAADRLGMTQPHLSRQIVGLEHDLGVTLLSRTNRRVELTAAGRALREAAPALLADWNDAVDKVRAVGRTADGTLTIGVKASPTGLVGDVLRRFAATGIAGVNLTKGTSSDLVEDVRSASLDAAFVIGTQQADELASLQLAEEACGVAVSASDPLSQEPRADPSRMPQRPWIVCRRASNPAVVDLLLAYLRRSRWPEDLIVERDLDDSALALVGAGLAYCFLLPSSNLRRDVHVIPLIDGPRVPSTVVWRKAALAGAPMLQRFVETVAAVIGSMDSTTNA